jgi:hypothetical protein
VAELRPHAEELIDIGVRPFVIGSGSPEQALAFTRQLELDEKLPIFSDQPLASYKTAGFLRTVVGTLHPSTWVKGLKSFRTHPQKRTAGDPWQLGGAMIVRPSGEVTWRFVAEKSGEHPAIQTLLDEARKAVS